MRYPTLALAALAAPLFLSLSLIAGSGPPNFTGAWEADSSKSQIPPGETVSLDIQDAAGKIKFSRVVHQADGKDVTSQFTCEAGGGDCVFDEGGRKAKVSLWYAGSSLMILKTDGPKEDAVCQWKLTLAPDGKTLNVEFTRIDPATDKSEKLVFGKKV